MTNIVEIICGEPPVSQSSVLRGPVDVSGTRYNDTATYLCAEGYEITNTNSTTITCQDNKIWSALGNCSSKYGHEFDTKNCY